MKKFTAIIIAAVTLLSLTACSGGTNSESPAVSTEETVSSSESAASAETETSTVSDASSVEEEDTAENDVPETSTPETSAPETSTPETSTPETSTPVTSTSETTKPETTKPETTKPETTKPETTKPETTKPETTKPEESSEPEVIDDEASDPAKLLNDTWALFGEDEKFPVTGGDFSSGELVQEAASFSLEEPDSLDYVAGFPAAEIGNIDSAATLMHMMNQNTFTAGAYHVVSGTDMAALSEAIKNNIMSRQWCCGFPDKLIVANVGDYIVSAYGKNDPINWFSAHLTEAYPSAEIVFEEVIL